jgi:endonuclease/exonuclease/phosphatase (EEP) superfamily protein YafD
MNNKEAQTLKDSITNRLLVNFFFAIIAYTVLLILWKNNVESAAVFTVAGILAVCSAVMFVLTKVKSKRFLGYGIAAAVLAVGALILKSSLIVSKAIGLETFSKMMDNRFWVLALNARTDVAAVAVLGAVYLIVLLIVSIIQLVLISGNTEK